jgi:hypothetical protein
MTTPTTRVNLVSKQTFHYWLFCLAFLLSSTTARHWTEVVDEDEYKWIDFDGERAIITAEGDPYLVGHSPAGAPNPVDFAPTPKPTEVWEMAEGCKEGHVLHEIQMVDDWGDGWGETTMTITRLVSRQDLPNMVKKDENEENTTVSEIVPVNDPVGDDPSFPFQVFHGKLGSGKEGFSHVCLEYKKCYQIAVRGGQWQSEVSWSIREVQRGIPREEAGDSLLLARGVAPQVCRISLADKTTGERVCPVTCLAVENNAGQAEASSVPSDMPSLVPSGQPSSNNDAQRSSMPSDAPSLVPSTLPTDGENIPI